MTDRRATFSDFQLRAPFGDVSGHAALAMSADDTSRVTATLSALDAAAVMRAFDLPYAAASRVDARLQAEWPGIDYLRASGNATAVLKPTMNRATRSLVPVERSCRPDGRSRSAVDVVLTRLQAGGAEFNGRLRVVDQRDLEGTARARVAEVSQALVTAETALGRRRGHPASDPREGRSRRGGTFWRHRVSANRHRANRGARPGAGQRERGRAETRT